MKFIKKTLINKALGVSVVVFINSSCKADGGQLLLCFLIQKNEKILITSQSTKSVLKSERFFYIEPEKSEFQDECYEDAIRIVRETRKASISYLQRRLQIGYNRAARIMERMEKDGVVGPQLGVSKREILLPPL